MGRLILRLVSTAVALFIAIKVIPGVNLEGIGEALLPAPQALLNLLVIAVIFGLVNAIVRPILKGLTCAITVLTLGLFIFVINALMLLLTSYIAQQLDLGFQVDGFVPALISAILISVVNIVFSVVIRDDD